MKYLLDTCTVSDFVQGQTNVLARIKAVAPPSLAVSVLTRMEVAYGLALYPERARKLESVLDALFSAIVTLPLDTPDALAAAAVRATLRREGRPIGPYDVLIAGTALSRGLIVVTSNLGEFHRLGGLQVENWR